MRAICPICATGALDPAVCEPCGSLLRWVRSYFDHIPGLTAKITQETRFVEDLGVDSLDWMYWPLEAEERLGVVLSDERLERIFTVGEFIRALRVAGADHAKL